MLLKSSWRLINMIKHLFIFMVILNYMFRSGSADLNGDQVEDNVDMMKVNILKQMVNNLKEQLYYIEEADSGQYNPPHSKTSSSLDKLNALLDRIKNIENKIKALGDKDGDSEKTKIRLNELENEMENLRKSLDNLIKGDIDDKNKLESSLANMTDAYNDLKRRVAILEEPDRLKELKQQLLKSDYVKAKLNVDLIMHDDKIIDVMKNAYPQQKDIDGYLYFAGIVNNLSRRLLIYEYIYNDIISKGDYQHADDDDASKSYIARILLICYHLKLMNKLEYSIIKMAPESADIYNRVNNLTAVSKKAIENSSFIKTDKKLINELKTYENNGYKNNISFIINNSAVIFLDNDCSKTDHNIMLFQAGLYLDNINPDMVDCFFSTKFSLHNRDITNHILSEFRGYSKQLGINNVKQSNYVKMFILSINEKNYKLSVDIYNNFKSNNDEILNAIKEYCNEYQNVDSILNFVDLLMQNDKAIVYNALYNAIDKTDIVNICDMLKLHNSLINFNNNNKFLTIINKFENTISSIIKDDLNSLISYLAEAENNWNLVEYGYNEIRILFKDNNRILCKHRYYLAKENGIDNCYFESQLSIDNFDNWYWKHGFKAKYDLSAEDRPYVPIWYKLVMNLVKLPRYSFFLK